MKHFARFIALCLATMLSVIPAQAVLGPESIPPVFEELLKNPSLSNPAMIVIDGSTGQVLFERNSFSQRKPASVMKVLAAGVALEYLDPLSVFQTSTSINVEEKTIIINGSFDPWISLDHQVGRKMNRASLPYLAFGVLTAIKTANGGSLKNYSVQYSNLYSQDVTNLKNFWANRGFKPTMKSVREESASVGQLIATESSPTMAEILDWMLLWSDNQLADRLARLSAKAAGFSFDNNGVERAFKSLLAHFEIDSSKLVVMDASGLSKQNKITAAMMGELLYKLRQEPKFDPIYNYLPVAGVSGTLRNRFTTTAPMAVGLVRAKTGTLNGTATLAGYVESVDREYVFVLLADEIAKGNSALNKARAAIDRVLGRIAAPNIPAEISPAP